MSGPVAWRDNHVNLYNIFIAVTIKVHLGKACCRSVEDVLSSLLLSKNIKINVYKTVNLQVLCGCQNLVSHPKRTQIADI
jgi:hypothetical protein